MSPCSSSKLRGCQKPRLSPRLHSGCSQAWPQESCSCRMNGAIWWVSWGLKWSWMAQNPPIYQHCQIFNQTRTNVLWKKSLVCLKSPPCVSLQNESIRDLDSAPIARGLVHSTQANTGYAEWWKPKCQTKTKSFSLPLLITHSRFSVQGPIS